MSVLVRTASNRFRCASVARAMWVRTWPRVQPGSNDGSLTWVSVRPLAVAISLAVASSIWVSRSFNQDSIRKTSLFWLATLLSPMPRAARPSVRQGCIHGGTRSKSVVSVAIGRRRECRVHRERMWLTGEHPYGGCDFLDAGRDVGQCVAGGTAGLNMPGERAAPCLGTGPRPTPAGQPALIVRGLDALRRVRGGLRDLPTEPR
jgi:hypothetical protein